MNKIALITGATSGIGEATALILAENSFDIIITGRRNDLLDSLEKKITSQTTSRVKKLCFDVRKLTEVKTALSSLETDWKNIDILVNNAGLAVGLNHIDEGVVDDWERMIDTNIKGLLYVTREVSPGMAARKSGHIINISSIAGKEAYEYGNVYCATKHAVDSLSKTMRIDLLKYHIKVTNIAPGMVDTEFSTVRFKGDKERADNVYKGLTPLYAQDIAETILFAVSRPAHVCINDLVIMPTAQAAATLVFRE
ncbi:MAG: SDR family NAD(P)-dependent oxidoreductase [Bacteroidales bacterium]|nr:SDR family NAD(P)-dependent oxidoreductase [Bacteroidales bacterium]MCB9013785.1 SDR family NAD(P)-dependent oxidoreductase [Bacteroidales bacterium]